jgi:amino acid adenylation domain-containing protein
MGMQETVLELFREQRIDKAVAYRLLAEAKAGSPAPAPEELRVRCRLEGGASVGDAERELRAIATWAFFLHVVVGREELALDHVGPQRTVRLSLSLPGSITPLELVRQIEAQLARAAPPPADAAELAWIAADARDGARRRLSAQRLGPDGAADGAVLLGVRAHPGAQGATVAEDWPDTLGHFHAQLWRAAATPLASQDRLPERHRRLLAEYNATAMYLPPARTLPTLLGPVLDAERERVAVRTTRGELTSEQYRHRAHRLAHLLRARGVRRNDRVAVVMHRSAALPVAFYGVVCAGAAYVPLEPDLPADRMEGILRDTGARILVTDADTLHARQLRLDGSAVERLVCVDRWARPEYGGVPVEDAEAMARFEVGAPAPVNAPEDLCYVIYTSGSTGQPKGVMIGHGALVNTLVGVNNLFNVSRDDRIFCFSSIGFDLSVWDLFGAALAAATVVVPTKPETRDPAAMMRILRDERITIWDSAPTAMSTLLMPWAERELAPVASMRLVMLGGEFVQRSLFADVQRAFPHARFANMGGATEGTIWSICHYPVPRFEPHWASMPYGKPLPNQRFHVLNDALEPCAIGEKGMLYIGGMGVAMGYLGDEERTRRAFVPAPWSVDGSERVYRTGDLGIMRADGVIELCGRADHQVKLRGYRVELGDIESQLSALEGVEQAAVIAKRDASNQIRLVAFYFGKAEIPADVLRGRLAEKLPEYMIPSQLVYLADPPVGATGKLDRKALEARDVGRDEMGQEYVQPRGEAERHLAKELARILRLDRVGAEDDFFLVGGDSLTTLQYISALSRLGFAASPADILQGRTIRGVLARVQAAAQPDEHADGLVPHTPMARKFLERLPLVDRDHWHQLMVIGFDHQPDVDRLRHAMRAVVKHHPLLRAAYRPDGLEVRPDASFELRVLDLRSAPWLLRGARLAAEVRRLRAEVGLASPSLATALLVRMGERDARLLWVLHHLVVDANCWRILVEDLATVYRQPDARLLRSASVADYVREVRKGSLESRRTLAAHPPYERMPIPRRRPAGDPPDTGVERDARTIRLVLSRPETARVFQAMQRHRDLNLNLTLLTALSMALRSWATPEVKFDVISNGRSADPTHDYSRTVGWFATHNPFQVSVPASPAAALAAVRAAWERYQDTSRHFVEVCNDVKGRDDHPLGAHVDQALLYSFLGDFDSMDLPDGWAILGTAGVNRGPSNRRTHELDFEALVARGHLMTRIVHPTNVVSRRTARRLLAAFRTALRSVVEHLEAAPAVAPAAAPAAGDGPGTAEGRAA